MKFVSSVIAAVFLAASSFVGAAPIGSQEIEKNSAKGLSLLLFGLDGEPVWKTEDEKWELKKSGIDFMDVTETWLDMPQTNPSLRKSSKEAAALATFPPPSHQAAVKALFATLSTSNMQSYLNTLTAFNTRYYKSTTGQQSAQWIFNTLTGIASGKQGVKVTKFAHTWTQFSVIARIDGSTSGPLTILGAHQDSINMNSPANGRAPGADDDGSGTVNAMEIFRALVTSGFKPTTPVEIHFYSGEEAGLLGSQAVATSYNKAGTAVKAMMQLDMTAFFKPGSTEVIAVETDYVDSGTNAFAKSLISAYSSLPSADDTPCGYPCSDHASWFNFGVPTTMLFEAVTGNDNQKLHTPEDTTSLSGFSWSHSLEFAKVALAFLYELSA